MKKAEEYLASLRKRDIRVFIEGKRVENPVDHPVIAPSIRSVAETYRLAEDPKTRHLVVARSALTGEEVNRFTHVFTEQKDLLAKLEMQRHLGRLTGTCFQRCVGMDAINALFNVTWEMDEAEGTQYHQRFLDFAKHVQKEDLMLCGAMTDPKGHRKMRPAQAPDGYLRVVRVEDDAVVIRGAKMHQTGVVNAHEIVVMPGRALKEDETDFAISCAVPVDAPGVTLVYGRQPNDTRRHGPAQDQGNARYGGQEAVVLFEDVRVPMERVFMLGQTQWAAPLVDLFAGYHRQSYGGCKPGNGDVLIGAAALSAKMAGVGDVSIVKDKLVEMVHLNETMHGCGVACSTLCHTTPAGGVKPDPILANVTKQNVTRFPYEMARLAEDIAGGLLVTLPAAEDFDHPEYGETLTRCVSAAEKDGKKRARVLRLIESMTHGTGAVAFKTESMHGAGSPQAQRMRILQQTDFEGRMADAARLSGVGNES
jgi:4-hydroxybutyryl-CoA dehydratase/vinylacetyl-CoA-Delta-isomerase